MIKGLDLLGLAHPLFLAKDVITQIPNDWAIGAFDDDENCFGYVLPKLRKIMQLTHLSAVRIQAHYSKDHSLVPVSKLKPRLPKYQKLARDFPHIRVYISHSCEYRDKNPAEVRKRVDLIHELAPACIPINSPIEGGARLPDVITELHGNADANAEQTTSLDGTDIYDINVKMWLKNNNDSIIAFGWTPIFNLRGKEAIPPPPKERTKAPTAKDIKAVIAKMTRR